MLGFIGAGSMGSAIVRGVLSTGMLDASSVVISTGHPEHATALAQELHITAAASNSEVLRLVGPEAIVIVAVKPHLIGGVLDEIRSEAAAQHTVIVSVAAGTPLSLLTAHLEPGQPVVRTMPNIAAAVGQSMTAICANEYVADSQREAVTDVFRSVGVVIPVAEAHFATFSAIAGCSLAFTYEYIDALARGAVKNGLPKSQAVEIATQAVLGAAQLLQSRIPQGATPASLADSVQSPGGTTVAGVAAMDDAGFSAAVVRGVQAAVDRDRALQG